MTTDQEYFDNIGAPECTHCGLKRTEEGHDGCLGTIPDVMNACCGHGIARCAYLQFNLYDVPNLTRYDVRGQEALDIMLRRRMDRTGKDVEFFDQEREEGLNFRDGDDVEFIEYSFAAYEAAKAAAEYLYPLSPPSPRPPTDVPRLLVDIRKDSDTPDTSGGGK